MLIGICGSTFKNTNQTPKPQDPVTELFILVVKAETGPIQVSVPGRALSLNI